MKYKYPLTFNIESGHSVNIDQVGESSYSFVIQFKNGQTDSFEYHPNKGREHYKEVIGEKHTAERKEAIDQFFDMISKGSINIL